MADIGRQLQLQVRYVPEVALFVPKISDLDLDLVHTAVSEERLEFLLGFSLSNLLNFRLLLFTSLKLG